MNNQVILKEAAITEALAHAMGKEAFAKFVSEKVPKEILETIKSAQSVPTDIGAQLSKSAPTSPAAAPAAQGGQEDLMGAIQRLGPQELEKLKQKLMGMGAAAGTAVSDAAGQVAGKVQEGAGAVWDKAKELGGQAAGKIQEVGGQAADKAKEIAAAAPGKAQEMGGQAWDALKNVQINSTDLGAGALGALGGQALHGSPISGGVGAIAGHKLGPAAMEALISGLGMTGSPLAATLQSLSAPIGAAAGGFLASKATNSLFGDDEEEKKKYPGRMAFASAKDGKTASTEIADDVKKFVLKLAGLHPTLAQEAAELFVSLADTVHNNSVALAEKAAAKKEETV